MSVILQVKWNGKRFPLEFASEKDLQQTTVKELKALCQRITRADPSTMKINAFGAIMNNDELPLTVYGLHGGCFVTLKLEKESSNNKQGNTIRENAKTDENLKGKQTESKQVKADEVEHTNDDSLLLEKLDKIQRKIDDDILPQVKAYEKSVKEFLNKNSKTDKEKKKQIYTGAYLGEQLMHVLFDLDGFICGPDNVNARQARKGAVKNAQVLLDKVDEIKSVVKNVTVVVDENI